MRETGPNCNETLDRIAAVHEGIGYPREVVALWALPLPDALDLWDVARASGARRVLEVGSFVGTSALLLAHALPDAEIHSVDPNLPLDIEFAAMGAAGRSADLSRRTLEIARAATDRLGLGARVRFHEGGFAVGESFALADVPVPVVGPTLCAREGPFDLAFVDGLHFEDAVFADVGLALTALAPNGTVVLHDCIGYWGSHVRRAVARVLEEHPALVFRHHPYRSLYRAIGTLGRAPFPQPSLDTRLEAAFGDRSLLVEQLARIVRLHFPRATPVGFDPLSEAVAARLGPSAGEAAGEAEGRIAIALDVLDATSPADVEPALGRLLAGCDAGLIGLTPPGESDASSTWSRPLAARVREFDAQGFDAFDLVQPSFEPLSHAFGDRCAIPRRTSFLLDSVVVARRGSPAWRRLWAHASLTAAHARALTDLRLQLLFATCSRGELSGRHDALAARNAELALEANGLSERLKSWSSWRIHLGRHHFWRRPDAPAPRASEDAPGRR